jgi:ABC-2 type transport system permease protein
MINFWLLKPLSPLYHVLASECAGKVVMMLFVIPATSMLALLLHPELSISLGQGALFFLAFGLAWALRFAWGYGLALLAFWTTRAEALLAVQDAFVFLLAGIVAPLPMLPDFMQGIAVILPFRYMVGFPVEILFHHLGGTDIVLGFAMQTAWLVLAVFLSRLMWWMGIRQYTAIGG